MTPQQSALLRAILDQQTDGEEPDRDELIRLEEVAYGKRRPTPRETLLLWRSPAARDRFLQTREMLVARTRSRWRDLGFDTVLERRAADAEASDGTVVRLSNTDFSVALYQTGSAEMPWIIILEVGETVRAALPESALVMLRDSGGLVWIRGRPSEDGTVTGAWTLQDVNLLERLSHFHLEIVAD